MTFCLKLLLLITIMNFKSCLEKDLQKYMEKLNSLGYSEDKIHLYKKIFKEKYEGIAKYLYYTD